VAHMARCTLWPLADCRLGPIWRSGSLVPEGIWSRIWHGASEKGHDTARARATEARACNLIK